MNLKFSKNRRRKLLTAKKHKSGSWCMFVPIDKSCGVKLYGSKRLRDASMLGQQHAAKAGLGPQVGSKVFIRAKTTRLFLQGKELPDNRKNIIQLYGYVTEIVDTKRIRYGNEYRDLVESLGKIGFQTFDIIPFNVGRLKRGNLVCLDFDPVYTPNNRLKNGLSYAQAQKNY